MIKHSNYILVICIFFISCGRELSDIDRKLQGDWKFVKFAPNQMLLLGGMLLDEIKFQDYEFQLSGTDFNDHTPFETKFNVNGNYHSDNLCIYFTDMKDTNNYSSFIRCAGERDIDNNYTRTVRYKFNGDTLIFSIYENKEDMNINKGCLPTHYFLKK